MISIKAWIHAFRLRTLPLSFSTILSGAAFAWLHGAFNNVLILYLALLTTLFLQILSNLANDYGDSKNGVDNVKRVGPQRAVQSGAISLQQMKIALVVFSVLSFVAGALLVFQAFSLAQLPWVFLFLVFGLASIWAAIKYTVGNNPYGYSGKGDLFVFLFFGILGVCGSYFLFAKNLYWDVVLWAIAIGLFSAGVLNVNNMRDIVNDKESGKNTIPVKIGLQAAKSYHYTLIVGGLIFISVVALLQGLWGVFVAVPLFVLHLYAVSRKNSEKLDNELKKLSLSVFAISVLLVISVLVFSIS